MKYASNLIICAIFVSIGIIIGFYIYSHTHENYENINFDTFSLYLNEDSILSVEIGEDKIIAITKVIKDKKPVLKYNVLPAYEKDKVQKALEDRPDMLVEATDYGSIKNYLIVLPLALLFIVLAIIILASRRGNIRDTLFRERKFDLDTPLLKARKESITWINLMSGESYKIISAYGDLSSIEQDTYLLLLLKAIHSEDLEMRRNASFALREIGDGRTVPALCEMLEEDKDDHVRMNTALTLGIIRDETALESLTKASRDPNPLVRSSVATALGAIGSEGSLEVLTDILEKDENWRARRSAVMALMKIRNDQALSKIVKSLKDRDAAVRSSAAICLGELGVVEAVPELSEYLASEKDTSVKKDIIGALHSIGGEEVIETLCNVILNDSNPELRLNAIIALELNITEKVIECLCTALEKDEDPEIRLAAAEVLAHITSPPVIETMKKAVNDADKMVQAVAREVLGGEG